jgi:hypothetical protein
MTFVAVFQVVNELAAGLQVGLILWPLNAVNFYAVFSLPRPGKIVIELHPEPGFGAAAEGFRQSDRHFRRNPAFAADKVVEHLTRYAKHPGSLSYCQAQRLKAVMANCLTWVRGVLHRHCELLLACQTMPYWSPKTGLGTRAAPLALHARATEFNHHATHK